METFTIKVHNNKEAIKLRNFLQELNNIEFSISKKNHENPANVKSLKEFQSRITKARKSVSEGKFMYDEELEKESNKW